MFSITLQAGHENVRLIEPKLAKQSLAVYDKGKYISSIYNRHLGLKTGHFLV